MTWRPTASLVVIKYRARVLKDIRAFFAERGVLELETPLLATGAATEPNLSSFRSSYSAASSRQTLYLNTSPEFAMKRFLAAYGEPAYQICKSFRADELGPNHNPEFTLLEWYRPGFGMFELMDEIEQLIGRCQHTPAGFTRLSYAEAFRRIAGFDPHTATVASCRRSAENFGIEIPVGMEDDAETQINAWLDWLLTQQVLPGLQYDGFTFLYDFPRTQSSLAVLHQDEHGRAVAARFELYHGELELANGFVELQDAEEQQARFEQDNRQRSLNGQDEVPIDHYLLAALRYGLPACSGVALGLDRLLMLLCDTDDIRDVLMFPWVRI
jgi:elongation factor P--(R)-beta-lysine ligase